MTDPAAPPPSYEEVEGLPPQAPGGGYPPYPDPNKLAGYSTNVAYAAYGGQPAPFPTDSSGQSYPPQSGYPQGQYPYGQSGVPPPPPPGGNYPPQGQYVHPAAVVYNTEGGVVVQQGVPMRNGAFGRPLLLENRRKRLVLSICVFFLIFIMFITFMSILF